MIKSFCFLMFLSVVFCFNAKAANFVVKVIKVSGPATYRKNSYSMWLAVKPKLEFAKNCQIKTGPKAEISLEIPGKGLIKIHEMSFVKLSQLDKTGKSFSVKLKLSFGKIWNRFKKSVTGESSSMSVETPAAVAAVRGTSFYVSSEKTSKTAKIGVWTGLVEVKSTKKSGKKMVKANHEIIVLYNKPLQDPIKMARDASNRAKEFQQAIENMGMAAAFPAARGMVEINDMQTNQARDLVNKMGRQVRGAKIVQEDFKKLKLSLARLYADTKYHPGKELSGKAVRKISRNSLQCLLINKDRSGKKIKKWKGPYIDSDLKDPFGGKYGVYLYKTPKKTEILMIYSYGVDRLPDRRGGKNNNDEVTMYPVYRLARDAKKAK